MKYDPDKHHRRSIRLQGYDYSSPGMYFITLCTYQRQCLFGAVVNGEMQLNELGLIVAEEWERSAQIRQEIELDAWILMPNHFHGIVLIKELVQIENLLGTNDGVGTNVRSSLRGVMQNPIKPMKPRSLSSLVAGFKSVTTKRINILHQAPETPVWQRRYYDHIIRNETALQNIQHYIQTNPLSWHLDQLHPNNPSKW